MEWRDRQLKCSDALQRTSRSALGWGGGGDTLVCVYLCTIDSPAQGEGTLAAVECRRIGHERRSAVGGARIVVGPALGAGEVLGRARHVARLVGEQQAAEGAVNVLETRGQRGREVARCARSKGKLSYRDNRKALRLCKRPLLL
jgi:hypothetical protein